MNQYVKRSSMYRRKHQYEILHWHTQYVIICRCSALDYVQRLLAQPSMWQLVETLIVLLLPSLLPQVQLQYLMMCVCVCVERGGPAHTQTTMIIAKAVYYNATNSTFQQWSGKVMNGWYVKRVFATGPIRHTYLLPQKQKQNLWSLWKQVIMYNKNWCVLFCGFSVYMWLPWKRWSHTGSTITYLCDPVSHGHFLSHRRSTSIWSCIGCSSIRSHIGTCLCVYQLISHISS